MGVHERLKHAMCGRCLFFAEPAQLDKDAGDMRGRCLRYPPQPDGERTRIYAIGWWGEFVEKERDDA